MKPICLGLCVYMCMHTYSHVCASFLSLCFLQALYVTRSLGLSAAIFAPGWVHENKPENEDFLKREYTFWSKLWPYLHVYGPAKLPFSTSFCQGFGLKMYKSGQVWDMNLIVIACKIFFLLYKILNTHFYYIYYNFNFAVSHEIITWPKYLFPEFVSGVC